MTKRTILAACTLLLFAACSSTNAGSTPKPSADVITSEQIRAGHFLNAYDAVAALHPNWLTTRGTDSFNNPSQVQVYHDVTRLGTVETLRTIATPDIVYIRHYDGISAQQRYGVGHSAGVILVSSHPN